jgi:hypothetical protein
MLCLLEVMCEGGSARKVNVGEHVTVCFSGTMCERAIMEDDGATNFLHVPSCWGLCVEVELGF